MPTIYKRHCNRCNKYYIGQGNKFCSKKCAGQSLIPWNKNMKGIGTPMYGHTRDKGKSVPCIKCNKIHNGGFKKGNKFGFKKGNIPWNKNTRGLMPTPWSKNLKGIHLSLSTEFKKGQLPYNKYLPSYMQSNWDGGPISKKCLVCDVEYFIAKSKVKSKFCSVKCRSKFVSGKNSHSWIDGRSFEPYDEKFNKKLKEKIRKRNNYICQSCGILENGRKLTIHHIDYNKKNNKSNNLIALCVGCNSKVNFDRDDWTKYFQEKMKK